MSPPQTPRLRLGGARRLPLPEAFPMLGLPQEWVSREALDCTAALARLPCWLRQHWRVGVGLWGSLGCTVGLPWWRSRWGVPWKQETRFHPLEEETAARASALAWGRQPPQSLLSLRCSRATL